MSYKILYKMIPIFSFIGESGSGKTFLIEEIIKELKSRGYKVGVIKHTHKDFEIDKPGKNSWKYQRAEADSVVISSSNKFSIIKKLEKEIALEEIVNNYLKDVDIVLTEGYKGGNQPKILILGKENRENFSISNIITIVSEKIEETEIPSFSFNQIKELVDFLLNKI